MDFKIENLNHASLKLSFSSINILFDPWFFDYAFSGGWGLQFDNKNALSKTADCQFLWLSHFHSDHFHVATLKKILEINPEICVVCNHSFNFSFCDVIKRLGFKNILPFPERVKVDLLDNLSIIRYPTTGIDNMLVIDYLDYRFLNYNDCNIPKKARKSLANLIGNVDIFMNKI